jgi:hypothetical protein
MRKAALLFLVLMPISGTAQTGPISQNGKFWSRLSPADKALYVWGFRDGYQHGYYNGRSDVYLKEGVQKPRSSLDTAELFHAMHPSESLSNGEIAEQVDKFYEDYRNTPVCMDDAVLQAIESLHGHPWTNAELAIYRGSKECAIN